MQEASPISEPLRNRAFLMYLIAGLSGNFGWQIQLVGASWLMTSLGGSPQMVALVQTAVALPVMLLSVPGGAISDLIGTRAMVVWSQAGLMVVSVLLAIFAWLDGLNPWLLLAFTFLIGSGRALYYPGWQSVVAEILPRQQITAGIAAGAGALNIARTAGPAAGGAIVAFFGAFAAFAINAVSHLSVIVVALRWPKPAPSRNLPPEPFGSAMRVGLRYVALSPTLVAIILRATIFNIAAISIIALMPLVTRDLLGGNATIYGILLGAFGGGAVVGMLSLNTVRRHTSLESSAVLGFVTFGLATIVLGESTNMVVSIAAIAVAGWSWITVQVNLNSAMQLSSPRWVLSRSNGIYQTFMFGGNAVGSLLVGALAARFGISVSLAVAGATLIACAPIGIFYRLREPEANGLVPDGSWIAPVPSIDLRPASGPILTTIEYRIREANVATFLKAMDDKRRYRLRDGASRWTLSRDIQDPSLWIERFSLATWAETQRHHARRTVALGQVNEFIRGLVDEGQAPKVRYELARHPSAGETPQPSVLPRPDL